MQLVRESQALPEIKSFAGDDGEDETPSIESLRAEYQSMNLSAISEAVMGTNVDQLIENGDVVFAGVNRCKTRKLISDHGGKLDNATIISGACDMSSGLVQKGVPNLLTAFTMLALSTDSTIADAGTSPIESSRAQ